MIIRFIVKTFILISITVGTVINYDFLGNENMPNIKKDPVAFVTTLIKIEKIEYYQIPFQEDSYYLIIKTTDKKYSSTVDKDTIDTLTLLDIKDKIKERLVVPIWMPILLALIVICWPGKQKTITRQTNTNSAKEIAEIIQQAELRGYARELAEANKNQQNKENA